MLVYAIDHARRKRVSVHVYCTRNQDRGHLFVDICAFDFEVSAPLPQGALSGRNATPPTSSADNPLPLIKGLARLIGGNLTTNRAPGDSLVYTLDLPLVLAKD